MSRLSTVATLVLGALTAAALTGCIKTKTIIDLKADGSGTASLTIVADLSKMDELKAMMEGMGMGQSGGAGGGAEMEELLDVSKTAEALKGMEGVRLVSQKSLSDDEKKTRGAEIVVAFDNLQALGKSGLVQNLGTQLKKNADNSLTLILSTVPEQMEGMDMKDPAVQQQMDMAKGMMPMFEPFLGGFEMVEIIKLPTAITETNGVKGETGNSVQWKMGFADMMDVSKLTRSVTFSGEGITMAPFKVEAKAAREAMEAAKKKIEGATSGSQPLAGSEAARQAEITAAKAKVEAMATAKAAALRASEAATAALQKANADLAAALEALRVLNEAAPAGK